MGAVDSYYLSGLVWALMCGLAAGSYATTVAHRLPRGESLFAFHPRCGRCGAGLTPYDLFPLLSRLWLRGKCRHCGGPIPREHIGTELAMALLFALAHYRYDFTDDFILIAGIGASLITMTAIAFATGRILPVLLYCALACAVLLRTLLDVSIFGFLGGAFFALLPALAIWRIRVRRGYDKPGRLPIYVVMCVAVGAGLQLGAFLVATAVFIALWAVYYPLRNRIRETSWLALSYSAGYLAPLLFPALQNGMMGAYFRLLGLIQPSPI